MSQPVLLLFLDGVGLGADDPDVNPFARTPTPALTALAGARWTDAWVDGVVAGAARAAGALDASFDHAFLPQSATGQTALLTGRDAVAAMGRPYGPWPGPTLSALLEADGLFHDAARVGGGVLANAYPQGYLDALAAPAGVRRRLRPPASVVAARAAGVRVRGEADVRSGAAVAADLGFGAGGGGAGGHGAAAVEAWARGLVAIAREHPLTYLDAWVTDRVGHRADLTLATALVAHVDVVLAAVAEALDGVTLVVVSDHGNLEDATEPRHTRSKVPLVALGPAARHFAGAQDLRDVRPALRRAWGLADASA